MAGALIVALAGCTGEGPTLGSLATGESAATGALQVGATTPDAPGSDRWRGSAHASANLADVPAAHPSDRIVWIDCEMTGLDLAADESVGLYPEGEKPERVIAPLNLAPANVYGLKE